MDVVVVVVVVVVGTKMSTLEEDEVLFKSSQLSYFFSTPCLNSCQRIARVSQIDLRRGSGRCRNWVHRWTILIHFDRCKVSRIAIGEGNRLSWVRSLKVTVASATTVRVRCT